MTLSNVRWEIFDMFIYGVIIWLLYLQKLKSCLVEIWIVYISQLHGPTSNAADFIDPNTSFSCFLVTFSHIGGGPVNFPYLQSCWRTILKSCWLVFLTFIGSTFLVLWEWTQYLYIFKRTIIFPSTSRPKSECMVVFKFLLTLNKIASSFCHFHTLFLEGNIVLTMETLFIYLFLVGQAWLWNRRL